MCSSRQRVHGAEDHEVIAAVVHRGHRAVDVGQRSVSTGEPRRLSCQSTRRTCRFPGPEPGADLALRLGQDIHAEPSAGLDRLPGPRQLGRAEQHQRRIERQRRERLAGEATRFAVMHCRDDGDPGAELAQHLAEGAGVDRLSRHGGQSLRMPTVKSWPHRLTAVLSRATQSSSSTLSPSQPNSMSRAPRALDVEGQHLVVDVAAQRRRHRHLAAQRPVQAEPDVVAALHFHHDVHDPAGCRHRQERQAVVRS